MTKEEVIKELDSLGFDDRTDYTEKLDPPITNKLSYADWSVEEIWFYFDCGYRFKYDNGRFYCFDSQWIPLDETDIATIIALYRNHF